MIEAAVWMTASQRHRLSLYGDVVFFDGAFTNTRERFHVFLPSVVDQDRKLGRVGTGVARSETADACIWLLSRLKELCPEWTSTPSIIADAKMTDQQLAEALPGASYHLCTWHMLSRDLPENLGKKPMFSEVKVDVIKLKECTSELEYDNAWKLFTEQYSSDIVSRRVLQSCVGLCWAWVGEALF